MKTKKISEKRSTTKIKINHDTSENEDELQRAIVKKLRMLDCIVIYTDAVGPALKFISNNKKKLGFISYSKARGWFKGVPDLIIIWKGEVSFLELKFGKGRLSEEQAAFRNYVTSKGYEWLCWRTLDECTTWINTKLQKYNKK